MLRVVDAKTKIMGPFQTLETFREHGNPVVQLEHLHLTARGLPLVKGQGSSLIDGTQNSRSN